MFFKRDVLLAQEYLGFLLLNIFDLFLTGYIFQHEGAEANKAAQAILTHFGPSGFAVYKFALVSVVVLACEGISLKSLRTSRAIVLGGCLLYLCVIAYESFLIITRIHLHPA